MFDDMMDVKLELTSADGRITKEFSVDDFTAWTELVLRFTHFLSAQYGYGIAEKVLFITDFPLGLDKEYAISTKEYEMILKHRESKQDLFNDDEAPWGDDE